MRCLTFLLALFLLLTGCDYYVALVTAPDQPLQPGLIGFWQQQSDDDNKHYLQLLPLDAHQYLVAYRATPEKHLYARACHWQNDSLPLIQITWLGGKEAVPADSPAFQYAYWELKGDTLTLQLLNPKQIANTTRSSTALANSIIANADDPMIFREAMVFKRQKQAHY